MFKATLRTITELLDSKKAAYSFIAVILACVLHLYFGVTVEAALLLVSPLAVATVAQAHVDASTAKAAAALLSGGGLPPPAAPAPAAPPAPAPPPAEATT